MILINVIVFDFDLRVGWSCSFFVFVYDIDIVEKFLSELVLGFRIFIFERRICSLVCLLF